MIQQLAILIFIIVDKYYRHMTTKTHIISVMSSLMSPVLSLSITFIEESVQPRNTPASPSGGYSEDGVKVATGI